MIIAKISGKAPPAAGETAESSLDREFAILNIHKLPIEAQVASIIEARLIEARKALAAGAYLSVIFLCGSVLEGVLLGVAQNTPEKFNRSQTSPKDAEEQGKAISRMEPCSTH